LSDLGVDRRPSPSRYRQGRDIAEWSRRDPNGERHRSSPSEQETSDTTAALSSLSSSGRVLASIASYRSLAKPSKITIASYQPDLPPLPDEHLAADGERPASRAERVSVLRYAGDTCFAVERGGTRQPMNSTTVPMRVRLAVHIASPAVRSSAPHGRSRIAGRRARPNTAPAEHDPDRLTCNQRAARGRRESVASAGRQRCDGQERKIGGRVPVSTESGTPVAARQRAVEPVARAGEHDHDRQPGRDVSRSAEALERARNASG
jgi:hypothetical protein